MSASKYHTRGGGGHASEFDPPAPHLEPKEGGEGEDGAEPDFLSGFRRPKSESVERAKAKASIAATATAAANAKRFVANFMRKKEASGAFSPTSPQQDDSDEDDGPKPPKIFNPTTAMASKGFAGAVANHLQQTEQKRSQIKAHRAHQMAVKGKYSKEVALTPTTAPPGAPRFYHALPTTLPLAYFIDLEAKADAIRCPPKAMASSRTPSLDDTLPTFWECEQVSKDLLEALKFDHARNLCGKSAFVANEHMQSLKDVPLKEMIQGGAHWKAWRAAIETFLATHATSAVNARYMLGANKGRWVVFGTSSILDVVEGVLIHIWQSDVAAREFIGGWKRVWQAVFESRLDGITCPFSIGYRIQGSYVTVTALCPIEPSMQRYLVEMPFDPWTAHGRPPASADNLSDIAPPGSDEPVRLKNPALQAMMRRFCHATCTTTPPPLMRGLDGRYYIMDVRWVLQHTFNDKLQQRPRLELLMQMRDLQGMYDVDEGCVCTIPAHLDRYGEEATGIRKLITSKMLQDPLAFLKAVAVRRCVIDLLRKMMDMELDGPVNLPIVVDANILREQCRTSGINLVFLPLIMAAALQVEIPEEIVPEIHRLRFAPILVDACQVEMIGRTLKDLAVMDLSFGACANTPVNDIGRRIHVPNRIASFIVGKDVLFFSDHLMGRLRRKFHGLEDIGNFESTLVSAGRMIRNMTYCVGLEMSEEQRRFTHFCPISMTKVMAFRPPRTAELYVSKQYSTLDDEIPYMWRRWESTPTTSPVRHSAFIQSAFATLLCRASEKYAMVLESAESCLSDFDDDPFLQAEIMSIAAETAIIIERDTRRLDKYVRLLKELPRADEDAPVFAAKYLNAGLLANDVSLTVKAGNALVRMDRATAAIHSATCTFCIHVTEVMLIANGCHDAESLQTYLDMQRAHSQQKRIVGLAQSIETMIHTTSVLVAANENSAAYSFQGGVEFARDALRTQLEGFGPRHRCTGIATYHLMILALRAQLSKGVPAVRRHMLLSVEALEKILAADVKAMSALVKSRTSMDLQQRVINVLKDVGDKTTVALLDQQRRSLEAGQLVEVDSFELSASPSGGLASSFRGSFALKMTNDNDANDDSADVSLHSPKSESGVGDTSPVANRSFGAFVGSFRASSVTLGRGVTPAQPETSTADELEMQASALRLSQVNFSFVKPKREEVTYVEDVL